MLIPIGDEIKMNETWIMIPENIQHALSNNLFNLGETRNNSKLTEKDVRLICEKISEGKTPQQISDELNIDNCKLRGIVNNIKNKRSWVHISDEYNFDKSYNKNNFSDDDIHKICKYFETYGIDHSYKEVLSYLNIDYSNMSVKELNRFNSCIVGIRRKNTFKSICDLYDY